MLLATTYTKTILTGFPLCSNIIYTFTSSFSLTSSSTRGYALHPCYLSPNYEQLTYSPYYVPIYQHITVQLSEKIEDDSTQFTASSLIHTAKISNLTNQN